MLWRPTTTSPEKYVCYYGDYKHCFLAFAGGDVQKCLCPPKRNSTVSFRRRSLQSLRLLFCYLFQPNQIGNDLSQFVGPILLNHLLDSMQRGDPSWVGYIYAFSIFVGVIGALMLVLIIPLQTFVISKMRKLTKEGLQQTDKRVGLMNEILAAMDTVKCYAWETSFQSRILSIRDDELSWFRKAQLLYLNTFILNSIPVLVTVTTFGMFTLLGGELTPARAFTSLSLFSVLRFPLNMLPNLLSQEFFLAEERNLKQNPPIEPGLPAISVKNGYFSWDPKVEKPTLSNINVEIPVGSLVAIIGGTGEGKTSLISEMIGELPPLADGSATIRGTVAYVRENILFGSKFEYEGYQKAIDVTALQYDINLLPGRDFTEIGERGVNISGGQKQRVSLARAVYSNSDIYIFDDPLSALDAHIAQELLLFLTVSFLIAICYDVFNLLPNLNVADLIKAFAVKTNDMMLVIYLSSLIRSVIALHNLINNKMLNKEHERAEVSKSVTVPSAAA
ncbi:hypothetical protein Fmac_001674 [Flemingia macrophylla]|uniref:ABC-type xenobiotic transporter n=1 Tax=Flemingia macrophylla TaxID=520843 RepID=A0ABD1NHT8_9FABA